VRLDWRSRPSSPYPTGPRTDCWDVVAGSSSVGSERPSLRSIIVAFNGNFGWRCADASVSVLKRLGVEFVGVR
jgi:hypothetical protein